MGEGPEAGVNSRNALAYFVQRSLQFAPMPIGWSGDRESAGSPFVNPDPWSNLHHPLSMSKSHSEVFRRVSDADADAVGNGQGENESTFLLYLKEISGECGATPVREGAVAAKKI